MASHETCIVLGVESQIGLAIIRELGAAGVRVIALTHDPDAIGLVSRHVRHTRLVTPRSEALIEVLIALGEAYGVCSLLTVSETNLQWLAMHRHRLGLNIRPAVPSSEALAIALDKSRTLFVATKLGVPVPHTAEPTSLEDVEAIAQDFPFPAVLKWKDPHAIGPALGGVGLDLHKAEHVHDAEEWRRVAERYAGLGQWPLVQQYCRGQGLGQFFFIQDGRVIQRFQHLRVAEWPPEGGYSSVCDALSLDENKELLLQSERLLLAIDWQGVAMVEYRLDRKTGSAVLMEINGRFWGSFPLAVQCGAGFSVLAHRAALGLVLAPVPAPRSRWRSRMVLTELKRLHRIFFQPQKIADKHFHIRPWPELGRFLADFLRPRVGYFVWSWRDPDPWLKDMRNIIAKVLRVGR